MKKIIIIGTHPNEPHKVAMLGRCIDHVRPLGYDIMVVSHYPIPEEIQSKVDYFMYDKENTIVNGDYTLKMKVYTSEFTFINGGGGHILAVTKNIINGINFANSLGYKQFFYMENDNIIHLDDLSKIDILLKTMEFNNKKMLFFQNTVNGQETFETIMFGGDVKYYKENHKMPLTLSDLNNESVSLERFIYHYHRGDFDKFHILKTTSELFFSKSETNLEQVKYIVNIFPSNDDSNLYLFFCNLHFNTNSIQFQVDDEEIQSHSPGGYHMRKVYNSTITVKIISDGIERIKTFDIDKTKLNHLNNGFLMFH
jgi:hypothetical protein